MAKTRTSDQKKPTRQKLLQDFCRAKGWELADGSWDLAKASVFFGKPTNKMRDLLRGNGSFGPQIARDLEEGSNGELAPLELDGVEVAGAVFLDWPFSEELGRAVAKLSRDDLWFAELALRAVLKLPVPSQPPGEFGAHMPRFKDPKAA